MNLNPQRRMIVDIGVRMALRDGVELVCDVYRPDVEGQWPVILHRNAYDRTDPGMGSMVIVDPAWLARQGFVVVVQDTRGRGESEGEFDPVFQEVDDGYDTVEWAAAQPWSTGAVGIYGSSYMAISTYQAVAAKPPHLRAAVAFVGTPKAASTRINGGMFSATFMPWWAYLTALMTVMRAETDPARKADLVARTLAGIVDPVATASRLPLSSADVISNEPVGDFWQELLAEPGKEWAPRAPLLGDHHDIGDVALLHITGYRDFFADHTFDLVSALAGQPQHRFIAGPYTHRGVYTGFTGARELPGTSSPAGPLGWGPLIAAWFDIHLRGGTGEAFPSAQEWLAGEPVRYYVEGENRWANAASWPPATTQSIWHLGSGGDARSAGGNGRILAAGDAPGGDGVDSFIVDPHAPFPTHGGATGMPEEGPEGIQDQREVDFRSDLLVYTGEPLVTPVRIAGRQQIVVHFGCSAPDADLCVKLVDVDPQGYASNVTEGFQRMRYRKGGTEDWLEPGQIEPVTITFHDTAHVFKPGHRIRVMIAGANFPRHSRNLHTKTVPEFGTAEEAITARYDVHHGASRSSHLILREMI